MKNYLQPKHLPAPVGLILVLLGLIGGIYLINRVQNLGLRASPETAPQQTKITNIGSSSFVVTWTTAEKTTGLISLSETQEKGELRKDFRDRSQENLTSSSLHFVLADNLKPQTKYFFKIISGGKSYDDGDKAFAVTTASVKVPPDNDIAFGKILTTADQPARGVIVYLSLANTLTQAAITDSEGNWMIPLSNARTPDLSDFSRYDRAAQIEEIFVKGEEQTASATISTGYDSPTPDIILGQNYNFLNQLAIPSATPTIGQRAISEGQLPATTKSAEKSPETELTIIFPAEDEKVNHPQPQFFGTGPNGEQLSIEVQSAEKITTQANTDTAGKWSWSPKVPLSPGEHTITVSYLAKNGQVTKVSRSFVVLAAGESELPSFSATPSASRASPSPTLSPAPTPKVKVSPSPTPTLKPARITLPSTESAVPPSGNSLPTKLFLGAGIATLVLGIALILF